MDCRTEGTEVRNPTFIISLLEYLPLTGEGQLDQAMLGHRAGSSKIRSLSYGKAWSSPLL
ncbi:hypothetical protein AJ88_31050 [Mesorhizobium amorphae CCBAU 01583]|nr:hypothetical protein AJ88_31050 [Mesorhizobium amorphae CCBAU 01583]